MKEEKKLMIQEEDGTTYYVEEKPLSIGMKQDYDINMKFNIEPKEGVNYLYWVGYIRNPNTTSKEKIDFIVEVEDLKLEDNIYYFKDKSTGQEYKTNLSTNFVEDNEYNRGILEEIKDFILEIEYKQNLLKQHFNMLETLNPSKNFIEI
jgi:hypothetical protein